ncbi:hypothetical protein CALCODRAFT_511572 [Calocera cornea HHB12733]|uniref:Uncharacterized protein n=1 Tax=Calocera cornea HHB12733 TaxID=1353952 RepID=A0A165DNY8_9BASI|nr:hypothetical protein CALCODRAFT_511572 [Calocera cornea HHB12733]
MSLTSAVIPKKGTQVDASHLVKKVEAAYIWIQRSSKATGITFIMETTEEQGSLLFCEGHGTGRFFTRDCLEGDGWFSYATEDDLVGVECSFDAEVSWAGALTVNFYRTKSEESEKQLVGQYNKDHAGQLLFAHGVCTFTHVAPTSSPEDFGAESTPVLISVEQTDVPNFSEHLLSGVQFVQAKKCSAGPYLFTMTSESPLYDLIDISMDVTLIEGTLKHAIPGHSGTFSYNNVNELFDIKDSCFEATLVKGVITVTFYELLFKSGKIDWKARLGQVLAQFVGDYNGDLLNNKLDIRGECQFTDRVTALDCTITMDKGSSTVHFSLLTDRDGYHCKGDGQREGPACTGPIHVIEKGLTLFCLDWYNFTVSGGNDYSFKIERTTKAMHLVRFQETNEEATYTIGWMGIKDLRENWKVEGSCVWSNKIGRSVPGLAPDQGVKLCP